MIVTEFGASQINSVTRPPGLGRVFYVDGINGNNNNNGIDPGTPFLTITHALTHVVADRGDYIVVLNSWQQEPAWPITLNGNHRRCHIIGMTFEQSTPQCYMTPTDDNPVFLFDSGAYFIEIAGFNLGGGVSHGCIEIGSAQNNWIHHCWFGHADQLAGTTPLYGVWVNVGPAHGLCVDHCVFLGDQVDCGGGISANGIHTTGGGQQPKWATFKKNVFLGCTIGIYLFYGMTCMILNNKFACPDVQGAAITLDTNCVANVVDGNSAMEGDIAMVANPYLDNNAANQNHWGANYTSLAGGIANVALPA
jgi:hypothetical protein